MLRPVHGMIVRTPACHIARLNLKNNVLLYTYGSPA